MKYGSMKIIGGAVFAICAVLIAAAHAEDGLRHYAVPVTEEQARALIMTFEEGAIASGSIATTIRIEAPSGAVITYDHWEDGYEADPALPNQSSTQVWGDGDPANGTAPGSADDLISGDAPIVLENAVPADPRNSVDIFFDGMDRISSTVDLTIVRTARDGTLGSLIEALEASEAGAGAVTRTITSCGGEPSPYTSAAVVASVNGTEISVDRSSDGSVDEQVVLDAGGILLIEGAIETGATVRSSQPAEICLYRSCETL